MCSPRCLQLDALSGKVTWLYVDASFSSKMCAEGGNLPQNEDIQTFLELNLKMLSYIGININLHENPVVEKNKFLKKVPALLVIALEVYAIICQVIFIGEATEKHDYFLATQVTSQIFTNILCLSKGYHLVTTITKLNTVLQELASVWRKYVPQHKIWNEILSKASSTLSFCKIFVMVTFSTVLSYGLPALRKVILLYVRRNVANYTCDYSERVFFMKYPFAINDPMTYFYVVLEEEYLLLGCALFWICGDTFFAQLTTHAALHFEMLRHDVNSLINDESSEIILKRKFVTFIMRHTRLLRICGRIEDIYSPVVLITVLILSVNICLNIFGLSETINTGHYTATSIHIFVLTNTLLQMFFYCILAETLTNQTSAIGDAIYSSSWTDKDYKLKVYIQMLILKCQNPFYFTAYGFFPIGHKRLTMVLNTAFSYYMMLRATT